MTLPPETFSGISLSGTCRVLVGSACGVSFNRILFVIIGIVDALHEHFPVVDLVGESRFQQGFQIGTVDDAFTHGFEVSVFVDSTPINTLGQRGFQHQIQPDAGAATVALHEGVRHIHFNIFVDDLIKGGLRHILNVGQNGVEIKGIGKREAAFTDMKPNAVRALCDKLKAEHSDTVALFAAVSEGKLNFAAACGPDAVKAGAHAGNLCKQVSLICGGNGGGRPDSAMSGGKDLSKVKEALAEAENILASMLK